MLVNWTNHFSICFFILGQDYDSISINDFDDSEDVSDRESKFRSDSLPVARG